MYRQARNTHMQIYTRKEGGKGEREGGREGGREGDGREAAGRVPEGERE